MKAMAAPGAAEDPDALATGRRESCFAADLDAHAEEIGALVIGAAGAAPACVPARRASLAA